MGMRCGFTGHRPQRLPWGSREEDPRCLALKLQLDRMIDLALERGCEEFLCGMARGCDTYFAEAILRRKLSLIAVLPCPGQADRWPERDQERYRSMLLQCQKILVLEDCYCEGCMARRNEAIVDRVDLLITVYDGHGGGTGHTVAYAERRKIELLPVWV